MNKPKVFIITGPTAVGKSDLAVRLAETIGAEVIGADSMQIYRGFDIGTGKITSAEMRGICHHMIDVAEPNEAYSVEKYVLAAEQIIDNLFAKKKPIIITGGTGLYINALINGYNFADASANEAIRAKYLEIAQQEGSLALYQMLCKCDSESAKKISPNDTKRIIRALEIYELTGETKSSRAKKTELRLHAYTAVLCCERGQLYERIERRVDAMLAAGLENEVRALLPYRTCQSMQAIGYKEFVDYFDDKVTLSETVALIKKRSRNYAKRQMTYFRWFSAQKEFFDIGGGEAVFDTILQKCVRFFDKTY